MISSPYQLPHSFIFCYLKKVIDSLTVNFTTQVCRHVPPNTTKLALPQRESIGILHDLRPGLDLYPTLYTDLLQNRPSHRDAKRLFSRSSNRT